MTEISEVKRTTEESPSGPMVSTLDLHYQGPSSIPGQSTKIPQSMRCSPPKKKSRDRKITTADHKSYQKVEIQCSPSLPKVTKLAGLNPSFRLFYNVSHN